MKFGLDAKNWQIIEHLILKPMKARGAKVWVFGSRARGDHQTFSDIDIMYQVDQSLLSTVDIFKIKESLVESKLTIKVDLVNEADLAKSYQAKALMERIAVDIPPV
jgi:predicted nucleotidyltransferase